MGLKEEITKRFKEDNLNYAAIGAEIKRHRLAMSKTLSSIADENCSVSYLCKIERNQVKPSLKYLNEICKKVNISKSNINYLLNSKELLLEAIKMFYFKDLTNKEIYEEKMQGLDNYRTEIIRLIFSLINNDLITASKIINKIWRLISSLADFDLMVFAGFYGIFKFLTKEYVEAADYLKLALEFNIEVDYFKPTILQYLFKICFIIGSKSIYKYYKLLEEEKIKYGENLSLDEIYYYLCLFYLNNYDDKEFKKNKIKIKNKSFNYNLEVLSNLIFKTKLENVNIFNLNDYVKILYLLETNDNDLITIIENANLDSDTKIYYKYLYYKKHDLEEAYSFLLNIAYPYAIIKNLYERARYYLNEMINSIFRTNKYKKFFDMYRELDKVYETISNI